MGKPLQIAAGDRFSRLTVIGFVRDDFTINGKVRPIWSFQCDCGNTHVGRVYSVTAGKTKSCGCLSAEAKPTLRHGHARVSGRFTCRRAPIGPTAPSPSPTAGSPRSSEREDRPHDT